MFFRMVEGGGAWGDGWGVRGGCPYDPRVIPYKRVSTPHNSVAFFL